MLLYLKGTACQPIIFQVLSPSASHQIFKKERNTFKILVILNLSLLNYGRCHRNVFVNALTKKQILRITIVVVIGTFDQHRATLRKVMQRLQDGSNAVRFLVPDVPAQPPPNLTLYDPPTRAA
jgi:hypothetical protein